MPHRSHGMQGEPLDEAVLQVLEEDQLVAAKENAHLGRREFSPALNATLWGLRIYVLLMLVLVAMQVIQAVRG